MDVVLVEDSVEDAELLALAMEDGGPAVRWTRVETRGALEQALRERAPDLVVSDLALPGFDGMEALAIVRAMHPGCPLVFLSGSDDPDREAAAYQAGARGFYSKFRLERLVADVAASISAAPPPRPRPGPPTACLHPRPAQA